MWFSVDCDIATNRKTVTLARRLQQVYGERAANVQRTLRECENDAIASVVKILAEVMRSFPDGDVSSISDDVFERWATWLGPEGALGSAFRELYVSDGKIKGWEERNGQLIKKREASAERMRQRRSENVQRTSGERTENIQRTYSERTAPTVTVTVTKNKNKKQLLVERVAPDTETAFAESPAVKEPSWIQLIGAAYEKRFGAHTFNYGKQAKHLRPLFDLPIEDILARLQTYWSKMRPEHINHAKFAETWQSYEPMPPWDTPVEDPITHQPTAYGRSLGFT